MIRRSVIVVTIVGCSVFCSSAAEWTQHVYKETQIVCCKYGDLCKIAMMNSARSWHAGRNSDGHELDRPDQRPVRCLPRHVGVLQYGAVRWRTESRDPELLAARSQPGILRTGALAQRRRPDHPRDLAQPR